MGKELRQFLAGSILILLAPVFSLCAVAVVLPLAGWQLDQYLESPQPGIAWNVSIVAFLAIGIGFYLNGYLKREGTDKEANVIFRLSFIVILYGLFTIFLALAYRSEDATRFIIPEVAKFAALDNLFYSTWILKGFLCCCTGLMLIVTSLHRGQSE
jgi:hypothetical protein